MIARISLLALVLLSTSLLAQELIWPGFRGPNRDGVAPGARPPVKWSDDQNVAWKITMPGPGSSSPIVVGKHVYVLCYSGYGVDYEDGKPSDLKHHLVCVDRTNGRQVWDREIKGGLEKEARQVQLNEHGFASPTPISDGELIYVYLGDAGIAAVTLAGDVKWQSSLGKPDPDAPKATNSVERGGKVIPLRWGTAASPVLFENLVIVNASEESNSVRAYDKKTGDLEWKKESANLEGCAISPIIAGKGDDAVLVQVLGGSVWGLDPRTGKELWTVETDTRTGMSPTPVWKGDIVYTFGGAGSSYAIRYARKLPEKDGKPVERVVWKGRNQDVPSPILKDGRLFVVTQSGRAMWIDSKDGSTITRAPLEGRPGKVYASPVLAEGRFYVVSRKRGIFVYGADEKLPLLAKNEFESDDSQFNASPALVGDTMYVRSDENLYALKTVEQ